MNSRYDGAVLTLSIFGASHDPEIGMTLSGVPEGETVDTEKLQAFLLRRQGGRNEYSTARKEPDVPEFLSGLRDNITDGNEIRAIIRNQNVRSSDYDELKNVPRPGHADYPAAVKYAGKLDMSGGGPFSGRMTAPLCVAGGICKQLLEKENIKVRARILSVGGVRDDSEFTEAIDGREFPTVDSERGEAMKEAIRNAKERGDSLGGIIECAAEGLPVGLGGPLFSGMEGRIAMLAFGIPAVKGIEFGDGFAAADRFGSENNDAYFYENGVVKKKTNHAGGILGGITDGAELLFRIAVKPTPSIALPQESVDLSAGKNTELRIRGRHDPCIVPRAVPVAEAVMAVALCDALLERRREENGIK